MKENVLKFLNKFVMDKISRLCFKVNAKPVALNILPTDKCLVLAPHPDDESIGCGGILNLFPEQFCVKCLTYGSDESVRKAEFEAAMQRANIKDYEMLNLKDKGIINGYSLFEKIDINEYDYIFVPNVFDQHMDHKAVSILLQKLLLKKPYKKSLKVAFYEVWSTLNLPSHFIDISSVVENKREMINCHKSQTKTKAYADKIIGLNAYRGLLKNLDFAETFCILDAADFISIINNLK